MPDDLFDVDPGHADLEARDHVGRDYAGPRLIAGDSRVFGQEAGADGADLGCLADQPRIRHGLVTRCRRHPAAEPHGRDDQEKNRVIPDGKQPPHDRSSCRANVKRIPPRDSRSIRTGGQ